ALNAQCTPDPACVDVVDATHNPGEICPLNLPEGTVGTPYSQVVTIIPPYEASVAGNTVTINKIQLTSVTNLPPGITYQASATTMFPYNSYCVLLSGTPTTAGTYPLSIKVIPFMDVMGSPVQLPEQTDDTSLVMTINQSANIGIIDYQTFKILVNSPNPFSSTTTIGYVSGKRAVVTLTVFDIIGKELYRETSQGNIGNNFFKFTGAELTRGVYIYSITNGTSTFTKQLVKK
ncbi:MAG: T9SS type A sorting domain-containing protein, partial [Bacteroidota bacterium]